MVKKNLILTYYQKAWKRKKILKFSPQFKKIQKQPAQAAVL
jgi:hypothetical protein